MNFGGMFSESEVLLGKMFCRLFSDSDTLFGGMFSRMFAESEVLYGGIFSQMFSESEVLFGGMFAECFPNQRFCLAEIQFFSLVDTLSFNNPIAFTTYFDRIASENSTDAEDAECSGVKILLTSREAKETKDQEVWCSPEEILAMLIAGVKVKMKMEGNKKTHFFLPLYLCVANSYGSKSWQSRMYRDKTHPTLWYLISISILILVYQKHPLF